MDARLDREHLEDGGEAEGELRLPDWVVALAVLAVMLLAVWGAESVVERFRRRDARTQRLVRVLLWVTLYVVALFVCQAAIEAAGGNALWR